MNQEVNLDNIQLSTDSDTDGLDLQAAQTWIYPVNYPLRDYQYNIVQQALLKNTLVSLPTGLGKTFIAAVVMYNFYRWYPLGKIIFMAPTRPLVKQQIDACYNIMAIPQNVTAELTGTKISTSRKEIWMEKRVFFVTPQVLQNDLETIVQLGPKIKCLVFDEAHKAKGNHAYCEVIRKLQQITKLFRVLALSATPGSNIKDIHEVTQNLLISHLEFRSEDSLDVQPYVFQRSLETVVVPLSTKLFEVREKYIQILEMYTRPLIKYKVIQGSCSNLTKGKIFMTMKDFQQRCRGGSNYGEIMKSLNVCVTLYHAFELLVRHGLRSFLSFFDEHISKPLLKGSTNLMEIMEEVREFLGPAPNIEPLPDGTYPEIPHSVKFGHPKFYKLRDILVSHFSQSSDSSRVIVFFEYRESVMEAYALLLQARPLIKPRIFLGQGSGVTQRIQISVVKAFREGVCNTLLSTCIGEEGLDVGDVDLIVCFDISNKSPVRMVQRMGRTGRKKEGRIVVMVTEGKEQQTLKDCLIQTNLVAHHVLTSNELTRGMYSESPRMLPAYITPKCEKIYITVKAPVITKTSTIKDMLRTISVNTSEPLYSQSLHIENLSQRIPETQMFWNQENPLDIEFNFGKTSYSKCTEKQRILQPIHNIQHSKSSELLVKLLQLADSKRFNIPISQMPTYVSQSSQSKNLKQGDIRSMFNRAASKADSGSSAAVSQENKIVSSQDVSKKTDVGNVDKNSFFTNELFAEISNFVTIQMSLEKNCKHCPDYFDCTKHNMPYESVDLKSWIQPDFSIFDGITTEHLTTFAESLSPKSRELYEKMDLDESLNDNFDGLFENKKIDAILDVIQATPKKDVRDEVSFSEVQFTQLENNLSYMQEKSFTYEAPKTLNKLLNKYSTAIAEDTEELKAGVEEKCGKNLTGAGPSSYNERYAQTDDNKTVNIVELLSFFQLKSIEDLFEPLLEAEDADKSSQRTIIYSPDVFDSSPVLNKEHFRKIPSQRSPAPSTNLDDDPDSPILCSFDRRKSFKRNLMLGQSKPPIKESLPTSPIRPNLKKLNLQPIHSPSKFTMNNTKLSSTPKVVRASRSEMKEISSAATSLNSARKNCSETAVLAVNDIDLDDFCDLSEFELTKNDVIGHETKSDAKMPAKKPAVDLDISDICDLSVFGLNEKEVPTKKPTEPIIDSPSSSKSHKDKTVAGNSNKTLSELLDVDDICDLSIFGICDDKETKTINLNRKVTVECSRKLGRNLSEDDFEPPKRPEESRERKKSSKDVSIFRVSVEDNSVAAFKEPAASSKIVDFVDLTNIVSPEKNKMKKPTYSQLSITQMLSLINKDTVDSGCETKISQSKSSQKENVSILDDLANEFNFTFNSTKKNVLSTNKKRRLNILSQNAVGSCSDTAQASSLNKPTKNTKKSSYKSDAHDISAFLNASISILNTSTNSLSDDDFEDRPKSPAWIKPKETKLLLKNKKTKPQKDGFVAPVTNKGVKRKKLNANEFINAEAALSDEDGVVVSEDETEDNLDCYETSFVADETQMVCTQVHARYLQSIRSPRNQGTFKIPFRAKHNVSNVFSQVVNDEDDTYVNDSFVVCGDEDDATQIGDLSELEILERKLKEMKRKKKRKKTEACEKSTKRRRIVVISDDSD